jgi:hypothetical protein
MRSSSPRGAASSCQAVGPRPLPFAPRPTPQHLLGAGWRAALPRSAAAAAYEEHLQQLAAAPDASLLLPYAWSLHVPVMLPFMGRKVAQGLGVKEGAAGLAFFDVSGAGVWARGCGGGGGMPAIGDWWLEPLTRYGSLPLPAATQALAASVHCQQRRGLAPSTPVNPRPRPRRLRHGPAARRVDTQQGGNAFGAAGGRQPRRRAAHAGTARGVPTGGGSNIQTQQRGRG